MIARSDSHGPGAKSLRLGDFGKQTLRQEIPTDYA